MDKLQALKHVWNASEKIRKYYKEHEPDFDIDAMDETTIMSQGADTPGEVADMIIGDGIENGLVCALSNSNAEVFYVIPEPDLPTSETPMNFRVRGYEVVEKTVMARGTSGGVYVPIAWVGKRVRIIRIE